jgi:hypothetical protein
MSAAVVALSWELLSRDRWFTVLAVLGLLLVCLVGVLLPESLRSPEVGAQLALAPGLTLAVALAILSHGRDCRLEVAASGFPARLFTLPVPTPVLVGPPLLLGTLLVLGSWLLCAVCLLLPCGAEVALWWPGLLIAAGLALIQAFVWTPFPLPGLRLACLVVLLPALACAAVTFAMWEVSQFVLVVLSLLLLLAGYAGALASVALARSGLWVREPFQAGASAVATPSPVPRPFSSPLRAHLWLECRLHVWLFLFMTVLCLQVALGFMWLSERVVLDSLAALVPAVALAEEVVGRPWLVMSYLLFVPFLMVLGVGTSLGRLTVWYGSPTLSPFLATRAIRTADLVKVKLAAGALGVLCLLAVVVVAGLVYAVGMGHVSEMAQRLVALTGSAPAALAALLAGLALLAIICWLGLIENLWAGAVGSLLLETVPVILCLGLLVVGVLLVRVWSLPWWPVLSWGVVVALVGKALAVAWVVKQLRCRRVLEDRELCCALAGWALLTALVLGVALWHLPRSPLFAGVTVLMMPLARPLAAPLALAYNRTR